MYSDLYFRQKRTKITTVLAVLVAIGFSGFLLYRFSGSTTPTRASQTKLVRNELANVSPSQAGLFWQTDAKETVDLLAYDERDSSGSRKERTLHFAVLRNLKPDTTYYYRIVSDNRIISSVGGEPFSFKTPRQFTPSSSAKPAYGKVARASGDPASDTLVFLRRDGTYPLVAVTKLTGEWLIPVQYFVDAKSGNVLPATGDEEIVFEMVDDELVRSRVNTSLESASPLPQTVVLGTDYSFSKDGSVLPADTSARGARNPIDVLFPRQGAVIPGARPLMKGSAIPASTVTLSLDSEPRFSFRTVANDRGEWTVSVPKDLPARTYTLTMSTIDQDGKTVTLARTFALAKDGEQVLGDATNAAEPTASPTAEPVEPTVEPTTIPSPTAEPTENPAATASATPATASTSPTTAPTTEPQGPTATPMPPVSGGNGLLYTITSVGLIVVGAGVMFLL
jgi:cell division septation protein DedD